MSRLPHLVAPIYPSPQTDPNSAAWGYLSSWCDELRLQNYSERTITTYQTALIQFFNFWSLITILAAILWLAVAKI